MERIGNPDTFCARLHGGDVKLLPRYGGGLRARVELPLAGAASPDFSQ